MVSGDPEVARLPTRIAGLDVVLDGGVYAGGLYLVSGLPGTGKTVLGNQLCFRQAEAGGRALYVTLLAESHGRMLGHIRRLDFYRAEWVSRSVFYVSAFDVFEREGFAGVLRLLREEVRRREAGLLVIDAISSAESGEPPNLSLKRFFHELGTVVGASGCTAYICTSTALPGDHPEFTMVDGLLELGYDHIGVRGVRTLSVRKHRGSSYLQGLHTFEIDSGGLRIYPRIEALLTRSRRLPEHLDERAPTLIQGLDEKMAGGSPRGTATALLGAPGVGKTILSLHFLAAGAARGERCLHFGLFESPDRILATADGVGLGLRGQVERGLVELRWHRPVEILLDKIAAEILAFVDLNGVRRVVIDSYDGLALGTWAPARLRSFMAAFLNELSLRGATTMITEAPPLFVPESRQHGGSVFGANRYRLSNLVDNAVLLRFARAQAQLYRTFTVLKMRGSPCDGTVHLFEIGPRGLVVGAPFVPDDPPPARGEGSGAGGGAGDEG